MNTSLLNSESALRLGYNESTALENHTKGLISEAEARILRNDSQIQNLIYQREQEPETIVKLRATITPIRKVPTELLTEIFTFSLLADVRYYRRPSLQVRETVLRLSQVCAFWRQVALHTPHLWRAFFDIDAGMSRKFSDGYVAMMQTFLSRSAPLPIPIRIRCDAPGTEAVVKSLLPSANRWESLEFACQTLSCLSYLRPGSLGTLTALHLECIGNRRLPTIDVFLSAQRLREVTLRVSHLCQFRIPWALLTSINLDDCYSKYCVRPFDEFPRILSQCVNLIEATFTVWHLDTHISVLVLPRLETLKVIFMDYIGRSPDRNTAHFFRSLAFPVLGTLELRYSDQIYWTEPDSTETDWTTGVFAEFQLRSPNITRFDLHASPMGTRDLIAVLERAPALRELNLTRCEHCINDTLFDALRYDGEEAVPLAPALEALSLARSSSEDIDERESSYYCVEKMVRSRWWSDRELVAMATPPNVARWKNIRVNIENEEDAGPGWEFQCWMRVARQQGLQVSVY